MTHSRFVLLAPFAILAAAGCGDGKSRGAAGSADTTAALTIAVVPKGTSHEFWKSIHAGANKAAQELSAAGTPVRVIWKGPLREDDREQQVQVVEGFTSQRVTGIVLAPLDDRALVRPVEEAKAAGVPTVIIDSGIDSDAIVSFVATDNEKGGRLAADRLGQSLGGKGKVLVLRYAEGSASTHAREEGFLAELKSRYPRIDVVSSDQYAGPTRDTGKRAAENLLNRYGDVVQGIFTPNESSTVGMLLALQDVGKAGKVRLVGFDASRTLLDALQAGQIDGLVVQDPLRMGYLGVTTMVDHLKGKPVERRVETAVVLVTKENLGEPAVRDVVNPPLERYLGGR
ncbi:MAG TPA: substrate-binding domain-containing protein [Gemmatimonadaceae bacterium]|nr:substrate-binding domain-containing protein [Gemmatimonadaceae bacterium]